MYWEVWNYAGSDSAVSPITHVSCTSSRWFFSRVSISLSTSHRKLTNVGTVGRNSIVQPMNWYCCTWCDIPSCWREGEMADMLVSHCAVLVMCSYSRG